MTPDHRKEREEIDVDPEQMLEDAVRAVDAEDRLDRLQSQQRHEERIRALEEGRNKLLHLLAISRQLSEIGQVEKLLDRILEAALEISGADQARVLEKAPDGTLLALASRARHGSIAHADDVREISHTILDRVLEQGETLYVSDALNNPDFMAQRSVRELSLRTVVAVPLSGPSGVTGALYVSSHSVAGLLEKEGVEILEAFGAQAAIALETASHRQRLEEKAVSLEAANRLLKEALGERTRFDRILGRSRAMNQVFQVLDRMVENSVTVLLEGETGTGKELVAQALHFTGPRREGNFIPVNCGAIPDALLESELFGYRKGAFTGAERDHTGLVEAADGGTLFLDEIGELSSTLQVKLLRVLQEGEVRRIGENDSRIVDVRIVAATHRDLQEEVKAGKFREDLFYRINVVTLRLPPLRERGEDVLLLAESFLSRVREKLARPELYLGPEAQRFLLQYDWPGNVRELENAVERAGALAEADCIGPQELAPGLRAGRGGKPGVQGTLKETLRRAEEEAILDALRISSGNISQAARFLGVSRQHLHTRIRKLGLRERI